MSSRYVFLLSVVADSREMMFWGCRDCGACVAARPEDLTLWQGLHDRVHDQPERK